MASSTGTDNVKPWSWDDHYDFPRDLIGHGPSPPDPRWPNNAKIALSFVLNYEEGGEYTVLNGDTHSESHIMESGAGYAPRQNARAVTIESEYDFGSRVGVWRIFRLFNSKGIKITIYAVGKALDGNPEVGKVAAESGFDVASHGYRWIDYHGMSIEEEKEEIVKCIDAIQKTCGEPPKGWYIGRVSKHSQALIIETYKEMGLPLLWYSDSYSDELPYWMDVPSEEDDSDPKGTLIIPYTLDCNDYKFATNNGWGGPDDFYNHLKNAFDVLYEEGQAGSPKMMSVGLHCRLVGKPGRFAALKKFVEYVTSKEDVWITTRTAIAEHWREQFPYRKGHRA